LTICGELYYYDSDARTELGSSGMRTPSQLPRTPARVVVSCAPCRSILYGVIIIIYIYVAQRRRPRIFYIYMTYTRLHNILLYYTHTQTNAHTHAYIMLAAYTMVRVIGSPNIYTHNLVVTRRKFAVWLYRNGETGVRSTDSM